MGDITTGKSLNSLKHNRWKMKIVSRVDYKIRENSFLKAMVFQDTRLPSKDETVKTTLKFEA